MFEVIYEWVVTILSFAINIFTHLLESTGTTEFYLTGFFIFLATSAFFLPLLHKGINIPTLGSDRARSNRQYHSNKKEG